MKKLLYKLVDLYLSPLKSNQSLALFAKHRIMQNNEHLLAAVHLITRSGFNSDDIIVDVGSYNGSTPLFFSRNFPGLRITGFEPNPVTVETAIANCLPHKNITILQLALDSEPGEKDFFISDNNLSSSLNPISENIQFQLSRKVKVQVKTLDECMQDEPGILLIKLDTQGRELNILKGATKSLKKTKYILAEMNNHHLYEGGCQYYEVDEFLRQNNFKLMNLTSGYNYAGLTEYDALYKNNAF